MRVSQEKTRFFKESVEYLGFIVVSKDGTKSDPDKVKAIQEHPELKSVYSVKSFLGLASYNSTRPITDILKGENSSVSRHM